jgi:CRP-like cAMP-binding protein
METSQLIDALKKQFLVEGDESLAKQLSERMTVEAVEEDGIIMEEDDSGTDMFFILEGGVDVIVGGTRLNKIAEHYHVGDMAIVDPQGKRSATIVATTNSVVGRVEGNQFEALANENPKLWKNLAVELANRLRQTNRWLTEFEPAAEPPLIEDEDSTQ